MKELLPESIEGPKRYSVSDPPHGVKVKAEIMQRVKGACGHLPGHVEMPQIGARMRAASVTAALRIDCSSVLGKPRVLDIDATLAGEQLAVAGVAGRHDAVEHVDTARHTLHEIRRRPCAHQVARLMLGQTSAGVSHD